MERSRLGPDEPSIYEKGWICDPKSKAKSVVLTDEGERLATRFLEKHFGRHA